MTNGNQQKYVEQCTFCGKHQKDHSEKLWEMHSLAVQKAPRGKILPQSIGFARTTPTVVVGEFVWKNQRVKDLKPIYMSCSECKSYLGSVEEDHADVLDGMCIECFRQLTGQEEVQLTEIGSISNEEFGRRMAWNNPGIDACFDLDNPKTWSDSFKEWHVEFVRKSCHVEKHCKDCKYCKKKWYT